MADVVPTPTASQQTPRNVRAAVVVGTALEWFDFYLYAAMAALVFGTVFFPSVDPATATLASVATFGAGFLARPFGGIVFGALGDRIGRKKVLSLTFALMGASSALIGLLPSYAAIGVAAPILLVVLRLLQGLGAGAEFASAIAVAYEHADPRRRGRQGSWPALGSNIGLLCSSLVVALLSSMSDEFLYSIGWRIPFVLSFVLVGVGLFVRMRMPETPQFEEAAAKRKGRAGARSPLRALARHHWRGLLVIMVMYFGYNAASYTFKTFSLAYLDTYRGVSATVGALGISIASAVAIVIVPLAGALADRIGAQRIMLVCGLGVAALAFPFFWLLDTGTPVLIWLGLVAATGMVIPAMFAAQGAFFASQFPVEVRASGVGTGREVSGALAGGFAPVAALGLVQLSPSNDTWGVSLLFVGAAVLILLGLFLSRTFAGSAGPGQASSEHSPAASMPSTPALAGRENSAPRSSEHR